ncbi:molybdate ABC transporter substrate-binding protein [Mycolicibacterium agri]|uniref:Molybdate ABC transporter substrate-binding protein n=1 Tax=Mycolicibacterium agri TaxID=36811 RepID=A0A2A7MV90_MYCAG|nr:molybdate ABC transporter substrate-binding protein [Mycolicibacterium agri]MBN3459823.1 molybdate ABC transporter substrate-binding protein [Mycobacterium sp. DSM 3803]MBX9640132.1 molybdate ABC transporter substrate-binding protein [Mycobacteriaceae bacterium]PEG35088.1 molybdate ABC transporter substrate-binding protein [Mycolicibacterium agri]GFG53764.1 molybdate-binding protein [Mycolicibacterium agri]
MRSIFAVAVAALGAATLVGGCSTSGTDTASTTTGGASPAPASITGDITVFAASSVKSTFTKLAAQLEKDNPGTKVTFNFAGSSDLVAQLTQGAPADVFASADTKNMTKAVDAGLVAKDPVNFATNTLTIVTPPGNPKKIASFADLAKPGTQVVVCAPQVPCGSATEKVEKATGVTLKPVSEESTVTDVLGKITAGQADAGLVYVTDAKGAGDKVTTVPFPESSGAVNTYPIAVLKGSKNPAAAQKFVDLVSGAEGRKVLAEAGFAAP